MSAEAYIHYTKKNKFEKYHYLTSSEKEGINNLVSDFVKELTTTAGTCAFNKGYGTRFISDIAEIANKYKVAAVFDDNVSKILSKYGIVKATATDVSYVVGSSVIDIKIEIEFSDVAVQANYDFIYNGRYVESELLEI